VPTPLLAAVLFAITATPALAQREGGDLTIVAPAAPGGGWDQTARVMQQVLRELRVTRSVQVVNVPGAAGTIGLARFVSSERGRDDALLVTGLVMVSGVVANHSPVTFADVTPIARLSGEYEVIVVPATSPFRTLSDLVAALRANPRATSFGGGSAGGTDEILARLLAARVGVAAEDVNYVAYSGGGQALAAVLGAHVSAAVSGLEEFRSQIETGALRALAISAPERAPGIAIPTFHEQGIDLTLLNWRAVVAPPDLSRAGRARLAGIVRRMSESPDWKAALKQRGWADLYMEGEEFERFLRAETARVTEVLRPRGASRARSAPFARFVLVAFVGAAALALLGSIRSRRSGRQTADRPPSVTNRGALLAVASAVLLNALLIERAGFVLTSAMTFIIIARAFGSRRLARDVAVAVLLAVSVHLAFTRVLGVRLPQGPWPSLVIPSAARDLESAGNIR
jgi:putative tricarboxylic transport membrane protein